MKTISRNRWTSFFDTLPGRLTERPLRPTHRYEVRVHLLLGFVNRNALWTSHVCQSASRLILLSFLLIIIKVTSSTPKPWTPIAAPFLFPPFPAFQLMIQKQTNKKTLDSNSPALKFWLCHFLNHMILAKYLSLSYIFLTGNMKLSSVYFLQPHYAQSKNRVTFFLIRAYHLIKLSSNLL